MKYEDDLHNCTPEMLAEMLEQHSKGLKHFGLNNDVEVCEEAARRLRELNKPTYN